MRNGTGGATPAEDETPAGGGESCGGKSTVHDLPTDGRVVMRHQIALQLDDFRAAPEGYEPRHAAEGAPLHATTRPFISVVIPNYNGEHFLSTLIAALDAQVFRDFEVIVVDDASSDSSVPWLEEHHPELRLIVNRQNLGFAKSCNAGAAAARGRFLVLLNSDTQPEPEWLAEIAKAVCANPHASIWASKVLLLDKPDLLHTTGDMMGKNGMPVNRGVWERDLGQYDARPEVFGGSGCAVAYRRELWNALGGFDEEFWMYLEDVDFAFRAQLAGARAVFVPSARVYHRLTATAGGTLSSYYVGRNTVWTIAKNMPSSLLWPNFGTICAAQLRVAADALRNIRGVEARARLRGQLIGVATLGRLLPKRWIIQSRCRVDPCGLSKRLYG